MMNKEAQMKSLRSQRSSLESGPNTKWRRRRPELVSFWTRAPGTTSFSESPPRRVYGDQVLRQARMQLHVLDNYIPLKYLRATRTTHLYLRGT
ncbi:hypothetical protein INR49_031059 [Caranx melampygus]|nr:hypothetical protein INR49_031059 [Caranx melampygus]